MSIAKINVIEVCKLSTSFNNLECAENVKCINLIDDTDNNTSTNGRFSCTASGPETNLTSNGSTYQQANEAIRDKCKNYLGSTRESCFKSIVCSDYGNDNGDKCICRTEVTSRDLKYIAHGATCWEARYSVTNSCQELNFAFKEECFNNLTCQNI